MKNVFSILLIGLLGCSIVPSTLVSCSDVEGDGIDSILWNGSTNPQNTSYHNPVWEPSLEGGTVYKGASLYVAISAETEWAPGLKYCAPTITSSDLMSWDFSSQQAFSYDSKDEEGELVVGTRPAWTQGRIASLSADFAKTVSGSPYWMVYGIEGENVIGAACASSQQGPFTDLGKLLSAEDLGVTTLANPFIVVFSTKFYLCYTTENGSYVQELTLRKNTLPVLKGEPTLIAGPQMSNIALYRTDSKNYYLLGTVDNGQGGTEIRYARCETVNGQYVDKAGTDLLSGSKGELLVQGTAAYTNPDNVCRVFENNDGIQFIAYNATAVGNETMSSGYARNPLFLTPCELNEEGWFAQVVTPVADWTAPKFK